MEFVTLMGAEDVRSAGSSIKSAAEEMSRAAGSINETLMAHQRFLDDWLYRFEEILTANKPLHEEPQKDAAL